jgi:response regulator of citrate/malate metabolism
VTQRRQKGIDARTLKRVKQYLQGNRDFRSAEQIAHAAGISRSTARAYLDYLMRRGLPMNFCNMERLAIPSGCFV